MKQSMQKTSLIPLLLLFITSAPVVNCQCPARCFCLAGYVTCSDLKSIPSVFPTDTRSLSITDIDVDEIPAGVFNKLPAIESIEIYQGKIGRISNGAFSHLTSLDLISLNELTIDQIESYAFSNITDIGTISIYMSTIDTIRPYAFWDIFALDDIKLFMIDIAKIDSFAFTNIDELFRFSFFTNNIGTMEPYAFSNFENVYKLSMYLNNFGHLGCGSIETLVSKTDEQLFYSNGVNCSCDLAWIPTDASLKKFLFSNWCQMPDSDERVFWEDISSETLECDLNKNYKCPSTVICELMVTPFRDVTKATTRDSKKHVSLSTTRSVPLFTSKLTSSFIGDATTYLHSQTPESIETSSTIPEQSSSSSIPSPSISWQLFSREELTLTPSTEPAGETSAPAGPPSEKMTTNQPETRLMTVSSSREAISTSIETSTVTDVTLVSTKSDDTSPNVVISKEADQIKAVNDTGSTKQLEPQNVSFREDNDDVSGSAHLHGCLSVFFLTITLAVI